MKYYIKDEEAKSITLERCLFEARHGRIVRALRRLAELQEEFPDDSECLMAEGVLHLDYLGNGVAATRSYENAWRANPKKTDAAFNYMLFSPTLETWRERVRETSGALINEGDASTYIKEMERSLADGAEYVEILTMQADARRRANQHGKAAAWLGLAINGCCNGTCGSICGPLHRTRATDLRALDRGNQTIVRGYAELSFPEERLALLSALEELNRALVADEYDAELWNFKSAWLMQLERHCEAISAANRALTLRPQGYSKPLQNKALALWGKEKRGEAVMVMREARAAAAGINDSGDVDSIDSFLRDASQTPPDEETLILELSKTVINRAGLYSETEESRDNQCDPRENLETLAKGFVTRSKLVRGKNSLAYVGFAAELLTLVSPETVFFVSARVQQIDRKIDEHLMHAVLYIAANGEGTMRFDAMRCMTLFFLVINKLPEIRRSYRQAILEPTAAVGEPFTSLDALCRKELARYHRKMPALVADQEPVDANGIENARRVLLPRFAGNLVQAGRWAHAGNPSLLGMLGSLLGFRS